MAGMRGSAVFALDWSDTEIDGNRGLGPEWLRVGAGWAWAGDVVRLDATPGLLTLAPPVSAIDLHAHAREIVARLSGRDPVCAPVEPLPVAPKNGFIVTDGEAVFAARVVTIGTMRLVVFDGAIPLKGKPCWVLAHDLVAQTGPRPEVICFTADALITTPTGPRPIDTLAQGDLVQTRDNGAQPVAWVGRTSLSGTALRRHPDLRPIRLRAGALGMGIPTEDLCVSPAHRMLVTGARAQALFGCDEVLVRARDLVDYRAIAPDMALHGLTYVHLLFDAHQILFANGLPTESFHPALAPAQTLRDHAKSLRDIAPDWLAMPDAYGPTARRCVSAGEAALLAA